MTNITNYTAIPREWLVWEWLLDGNANDTSGGWNDGTATDVTWDSAEIGYVKECGGFNWSSSKIEINPYVESQITWDLTISIWFYVNDFTSSDDDEIQLFCINDSWESLWTNSLWQLEIRIEDSNNHCIRRFHEYWDWANQYIDTDIIIWESKRWYNIIAIRDVINKNVKFYLDWVILYTYNYDYNPEKDSDDSNNTQHIQIWYNTSDSEWWYYNWNLWLARIYNRTLSLNEVQNLYQEWLKRLWHSDNLPPSLLSWLVGYWDFNNWSLANLVDGTLATNNWATLTSDHLGYNNNAYSFDGSDDYIDNVWNLIPSWQTRTYNFIVYPTDLSWWDNFSSTNPRNIIWQKTNSTTFIRLLWTRINIGIHYDGNWYETRSDEVLTENEWQFITCIITPWEKGKIYRNWILLNNWWMDDTIPSTWDDTDNWLWKDNWDDRYYVWTLWLLKIFNRALSAAEIKQLYYYTSKQYIYPYSKYYLPNLQDWLVYSLGSGWHDVSWNSHHWTLNWWVTETTVGLNNVYSFDGVDDYINIWTISNVWTTDFTISSHFYTTNWDDQLWIIDNRPIDWDYPRIFVSKYSDNTVRFFLNDWTIYNLYSSEIEIWKWINVVVVRSWSECKIYINWILNVSDTLTNWDVLSWWDWDVWTLNNNDDTKTAVFDWQISNVKIWNRVLSEQEIRQLYYSNYIQ